MYRKLRYVNNNNESLDLSVPWDTFLYDLGGAGFSYTNTLSQNNYIDHVDLSSVVPVSTPISGQLIFDDAADSRASMYEKMERAQRILNYDQLLNRAGNQKQFGRLYYQNERGQEVFTLALVEAFRFGEIMETPLLELPVDFQLTRGSNVWINTKPKRTVIEMVGGVDAHFHPYSHPYAHGLIYPIGNGEITALGGTDFAKIIVKIHGEVAAFRMQIQSTNGLDSHLLIYQDVVGGGETLVIDNIKLQARLGDENIIGNFDLVNGDSPFFSLLPNTTYSVTVQSDQLQGSVEVEMYETWVAVP